MSAPPSPNAMKRRNLEDINERITTKKVKISSGGSAPASPTADVDEEKLDHSRVTGVLAEDEPREQGQEQKQDEAPSENSDLGADILPTHDAGCYPGDAYAHIFTAEMEDALDRAAKMRIPGEDEEDGGEDGGEGELGREERGGEAQVMVDEEERPSTPSTNDWIMQPETGDLEANTNIEGSGLPDLISPSPGEADSDDLELEPGQPIGDEGSLACEWALGPQWADIPLVEAICCMPPLPAWSEEQQAELERAAAMPLPDESEDM
ncbi:hypothetical protein BU26DRAFT_572067 [Trematosphaeria pertusa]|uniref:Uncharacterized protein n=1 Tax=Trematosphaeria pertusa TaxID=390896 RepID=A0A6A6HSZ2_9PLEO|nr:uncharacterized protein BU26DRAFT_572067 [Trematosphaeria pertusa]KAF2241216.1 hypothetical protein BU26DRAFT_572067 [Trematosphaeria pertusa]